MSRRILVLIALFLAARSSAQAATDQWIEVRSDHFTVLTNSSEKQGRHIIDQFERMRWMFHQLYPALNVDPPIPIVVLAAKDAKSFQALEPAVYLAKGQLKLGGLFQRTPDKNYVLLRLDLEQEHPFATVYHEYTHLMFSGFSDWLPLWLNEGLAEFYQNTDIKSKTIALGQAGADDILYLRQNRLIPLETLFKVDHSSPYYHDEEKGSVFYAESWALTHYLLMTDFANHTERLQNYMILLSQRTEPIAAAQKAFGDLKQLQSSLDGYILGGDYQQFNLQTASAPLDDGSYKVRTLTQTESDAARADFLASVGRKEDAQALLKPILDSDATNAQARETMGFLAFRDGDIEAARKWYAEAVKLDSQSYLSQYYFAIMSMRQSGAAQDSEIEASLRSAIRLNPTFAPSYDALASFLGQHHSKLDEAQSLCMKAIQLDHGNLGYRINAANVLMAEGKFSEAVAVLQKSINLARNPNQTLDLQRRIAQTQQAEKYRSTNSRPNADPAQLMNGTVEIQTRETSLKADPKPKHPAEAADGPKHEAIGLIHGVQCSESSTIELHVDAPKGTVFLYSNNYYKLEYSALGFTPAGDMNPCHDLEGMSGRVQYAESSDKTVDGQVLAIELRK